MREFFKKLIGNDAVKARLSSAIMRDTLPHAFLFVGAYGSGKRTLALELAAALNCENKHGESHALPCHACNSCRRIREGLYPDVHYIRREKDKMSIGVRQIEEMCRDVMLSAAESDYRIYIIEEAEKLTPEAQNAMLKTLEEPPLGVVIILLAEEADRILTTIKSRVQTVKMSRFTVEELTDITVKLSDTARAMMANDPEALGGIITAADGRIGKALQMLESGERAEDVKDRRALTESLIEAMRPSAPFAELYTEVKKLSRHTRVEFKEALEEMLLALRDLVVIKYERGAEMCFFTSRSRAAELAERMSLKRLFALYDIFKGALEDNSKNAQIGVQVANLAAAIKLI